MLFIKEDEPGRTGSISPGKLIAWFWVLLAVYFNLAVLEIWVFVLPSILAITFWKWLLGNFVLGMISVGFYWGMAKGAFAQIVDALVKRVSNDN